MEIDKGAKAYGRDRDAHWKCRHRGTERTRLCLGNAWCGSSLVYSISLLCKWKNQPLRLPQGNQRGSMAAFGGGSLRKLTKYLIPKTSSRWYSASLRNVSLRPSGRGQLKKIKVIFDIWMLHDANTIQSPKTVPLLAVIEASDSQTAGYTGCLDTKP